MKPLKLINLFDSIPQINNYSHYGSSLEKLFKMSSLRHFIKTLKFKEDFHKKYLKEGYVKEKKKEYDIYEQVEMNERKNNEEEDIFSLPASKSENKMKIKSNINLKSNYIFFHKKPQNILNESPDPLRYNPNYNSISKNIPSFKIVNPVFDDKNLKKNNSLNNGMKKNKSKIVLNDIKEKRRLQTINNESRNDSSSASIGRDNRFITEIPIKNRNNVFLKNYSYKKYEQKFPTINNDLPHYMQNCKSYKISRDNDTNNNLKTNSFYNKNRAVDFKKMQSRSTKMFINLHSLEVPNFGYYVPKYNFIQNRQININLNKKPFIDKHHKKQFLLKKILCSYYMEPNYHIIDNNKLNNLT
jgi:hypothetical protein